MRVLIGVDGSEGSFAAVQLAGRILSPERDELTLYYSPPAVAVRARPAPSSEILERASQALATAVFDDARGRLPEPLREKTDSMVGSQKARHGLVVAADEKRVDLIVIGTATSPGLGAMLGSVARAVAHASPVPVLVVRGEVPTDRGPRVLLACDGHDPSQHAGEFLQRLSWPEGTEGRVITVVESPMEAQIPEWLEQAARESDEEAMAKALVEEHDAEKQQAHDEMAGYCRELPPPFHERAPLVAGGLAADEILEAVEREKIDLVVCGSRGLGPVKRLLVGSTSEKLLAHAPCSVLIVREHERS